VVLSREELARLIEAAGTPKSQAALSVAYGAGLRASEVVSLKVGDNESNRMTLRSIAADPKHLGARIGATLVPHTWGSSMTHHPHVHGIVPGGGISLDGQRWVACRPCFFLPVRVLSRRFRHLFLDKPADAHRPGKLQFFVSIRCSTRQRSLRIGSTPCANVSGSSTPNAPSPALGSTVL